MMASFLMKRDPNVARNLFPGFNIPDKRVVATNFYLTFLLKLRNMSLKINSF